MYRICINKNYLEGLICMGSHACTVSAGLATVVICFLLSSLDGLQLLLAFMLAGLGWSFWSLLVECNVRQGGKLARSKQPNFKRTSKRQSARVRNIYPFRQRLWTGSVAGQRREGLF